MPGPEIRPDRSDGEHQQKRDQEREDAQSFGKGDADEKVRGLRGGRRRVAQGTSQEVARDVAYADTSAAKTDGSQTAPMYLPMRASSPSMIVSCEGKGFRWGIRP